MGESSGDRGFSATVYSIMQREKYFIIAAGGYLPKPVVEEIVVDEAEMGPEFSDFDEFKTHLLEEAVAGFSETFAKIIVLTEAQARDVSVYLNN